MKQRIVLPLLLICLLLTACQVAKPTAPRTSGGSLETPTAGTTAPTTLPTQTLSTGPTTVPVTTIPLPPETTVPEINRTVTPINRYVYGENPDGTPNYDNRIALEPDKNIPNFDSILPGEVVLSDNIVDAIRKYPSRSVFYVAVCFKPTIDWEMEEYPFYGDAYYALRDEIMTRFKDANYYVINGGSYAEENCFFYLLASAEQLWDLNCGDDLAICVYVPYFAY